MTENPPPFSEPNVVPIIFVNGANVETIDGTVVMTFWTLHEEPPERRIVARLAAPKEMARDLSVQIREEIARHEH